MALAMVPMAELVPILSSEARRHDRTLGILFALIALLALLVGVLWPRKYEASTTILVQESNIVTGLMEGRAVATGVTDRASIAREVIFSRKVMDDILATGGWMAQRPPPSAVEQDRLIESIEGRTRIASPRDNLIQITYSDSTPERAFKVTQRLAELFIRESIATKERESRNAFDFIDSQVEAYRQKLASAEDKLKAYRDANPDARPGSETDANTRIGQLRTQVEQSRMEVMEQHSKEAELATQLSGESEITMVQTRAGQIEAQLAELQGQLDRLRLNYTDDYPDVVRIRHQMQDLKDALARADQEHAATPTALDSGIHFSPVYQELRSKLGEARRNAAAAAARMNASERLLDAELQRSSRIAGLANTLAELTRDYEVNRDIYQDLLKRRENARVSMSLDAEQRGPTFRIQEPAIMPLRPSGLRLTHFAVAGLMLGLALPLGVLFGYVRFDPRVRSAAQVERVAGVPVLATVPYYATPRDRRRRSARTLQFVLIVAVVVAAYALTYLFQLKG
jgi:polysaccharide chain length determinant protein (PEP-CTERM system associated)